MVLGIIKLVKQNNLNSVALKMIDKILRDVIEFNIPKYPQSENVGRDLEMSNRIINKDERKNPKYDILVRYWN